VVDRLGLTELKAMAKPTRAWVKEGNPPPLCFTLERLENSADVFPLELLDIKEQRRVLFGDDVVAGVEVSEANLRHELEYELKSKLIQLRVRYLLAEGAAKATAELLVNSLSTFLVLFRGAWRLFQQEPVTSKLEALRLLGAELDFPIQVFETVHELKTGIRAAKGLDTDELFQQYLSAIETVVDKVDRHLHTQPS